MNIKSVANGRCSGENRHLIMRGKELWMVHEKDGDKNPASRQRNVKGMSCVSFFT